MLGRLYRFSPGFLSCERHFFVSTYINYTPENDTFTGRCKYNYAVTIFFHTNAVILEVETPSLYYCPDFVAKGR